MMQSYGLLDDALQQVKRADSGENNAKPYIHDAIQTRDHKITSSWWFVDVVGIFMK